MHKTNIGGNIFVLRFTSQYELASTFLRVQEHYESSRFRNVVFTLAQYKKWYAAEFGAFTYYRDWSGFNVPSSAFAPFLEGRFNPLHRKEQRLLRLFRDEHPPYYVIGISSDADLKHEIAHALFYMRADYREAVMAAMRPYDTSGIRKQLASLGYHRHVLIDEVHAYLVAPGGSFSAAQEKLAPLQKKLRAIFARHAGQLSGAGAAVSRA